MMVAKMNEQLLLSQGTTMLIASLCHKLLSQLKYISHSGTQLRKLILFLRARKTMKKLTHSRIWAGLGPPGPNTGIVCA
jgi:hypothetical protein